LFQYIAIIAPLAQIVNLGVPAKEKGCCISTTAPKDAPGANRLVFVEGA
jgi:hypothetical protein